MASTPEPGKQESTTFRTQRFIPHPPESIFQAFTRPDLLARWWGPAGFTNVFEVFEFKPGGRWKYVMHGPGGKHHPNESVFREIDAPSRIVIHHVSRPIYTLTITLAAQEGGTAITWNQEFEDSEVAAKIAHIVVPANEENLDRLGIVLAGGQP